MEEEIKKPELKVELHPRNLHREEYDFQALVKVTPGLKEYISQNEHGNDSIDFFNYEAVKTLNRALLKLHYKIDYWDIPEGYLCPPVPGRADYIHHIADLIGERMNFKTKIKVPRGSDIKCLDIGVGANCIYPLIGHQTYGWSFIGSDIDSVSVESASDIIVKNELIASEIEIKKQSDPSRIFVGIFKADEVIDITICNPPFHESVDEARAATTRKNKNLGHKEEATLNFGGKENELWCDGGELQFISQMIEESETYKTSCYWFTTLVSKETNIPKLQALLESKEITDQRVIPMTQGNKQSRILCWSYLTDKQRKAWEAYRFN